MMMMMRTTVLVATALLAGCYPASQGPSEPCDVGLGVDACGAGLVCAALDGRKQATCYAERSRAGGTGCTDNRLCTSLSCNQDAGKCRGDYLATCDADAGCVDDGHDLQCLDDGDRTLRCRRHDEPGGVPCSLNAECTSDDCRCAGVSTDTFSCCQ